MTSISSKNGWTADRNNSSITEGWQGKLVKWMERSIVLQSIWEVSRSFCRDTTIHGMKHIFGSADYNRWHKRVAVRISRVLWFLSCVAGLYCALLMMRLVWRRFELNPTITTIDTTSHPIWEVAFPGVTICNINKVYAPNAVNITRKLVEVGVSVERIQKFFELVPNLITPDYIDDDFLNITSILSTIGYDTDTLMSELVQPCEQMLKVCSWKGVETPCQDIFKQSRSNEGFCCSFNYKALKLSLERNDSIGIGRGHYYVSGAGPTMGLSVMIDVEQQQSLAMAKSIYGAEVVIHDAEEFPQRSLISAVAQPGRDLSLGIVPSVIVSKSTIRSVPIADRSCYFADEEKLRATRKYTLNSCLAECRVDHILSKCGCLPFFYPEIPAIENKYRQCGLRDVACLRMYRSFLSSLQPPNGTTGFNTTEEIGMVCTCLPACTETTYGVVAMDVRRSSVFAHSMQLSNSNLDLTNLTTMVVYFRDLSCIRYRRDVYMTWDGLFASFGGIFGLCLGGSILSLVELAYFFTIRLSLTIYRMYRGKPTKPEAKTPAARESEERRHEKRFEKAVAESRRIYNLSPVLNKHLMEFAHQRRHKKTANGVW